MTSRDNHLLLLGAIVLAALLTMACGLLQMPSRSSTVPATPTSEALAQPSPTPEIRESAPEVVTPTPGAPLIEGRPYLLDTTPGAVIYYDPWIDYQSVQQVKEVYAFTRGLLAQDLNIADIAPVTVYLALEDQFQLFAKANQFAHPSFLAGFYSGNQEVDATVYLNAQALDLSRNFAHELTHVATPWLPTWVSEGVADYVGSRTGLALQNQAEPGRILKSRQTVRTALKEGALLDRKGLESFDWVAAQDYHVLETAYAQSWQLMEYIARHYTPNGLAKLVAAYRTGLQEGDDPFLRALGVPADTVWSEFSMDITDSLTPEEQVGQSLCGLRLLADQGGAVTHDLNQFITQPSPGQSENPRDTLLGFGQQWDSLAKETNELAAPGPATSISDLWHLYFQAMSMAMQELAQGSDASANRSIAVANQAYSLAAASLRDSFLQRPWLACE